jgi:hypothetical protein
LGECVSVISEVCVQVTEGDDSSADIETDGILVMVTVTSREAEAVVEGDMGRLALIVLERCTLDWLNDSDALLRVRGSV